MRELWSKYEKWLGENFSHFLNHLAEGATEEEILELENYIGKPLPSDFKESLQIHNGEKDNRENKIKGIFGGWTFYSTYQIKTAHEQWIHYKNDFENYNKDLSIEGSIQQGFFNDYWLPFSIFDIRELFLIDLNPHNEGTYGQIIAFNHETDSRKKVFDSFYEMFEWYLNELKEKRYTIWESDNNESEFDVDSIMDLIYPDSEK